MNILRIQFDELYRRHLCRHGEIEINALHLLAVCGIYISALAIFAIALRTLMPEYGLPQLIACTGLLAVPYLIILMCNIPAFAFILTAVSLVVIITAAVLIPTLPVWLHLLLILLWHRFQLWSHRRCLHTTPMNEFSEKYRKGPRLSLLLAVYELPILLYFIARQFRGETSAGV